MSQRKSRAVKINIFNPIGSCVDIKRGNHLVKSFANITGGYQPPSAIQLSSGETDDSQSSQESTAKRVNKTQLSTRSKNKEPHLESNRSFRFRPGTVALRDIRRYQKSTKKLIPKAPFQRLVKEILVENQNGVARIQATAVEILHEAAEHYIVEMFNKANDCAIHGARTTLMPKDLMLTKRIRSKK